MFWTVYKGLGMQHPQRVLWHHSSSHDTAKYRRRKCIRYTCCHEKQSQSTMVQRERLWVSLQATIDVSSSGCGLTVGKQKLYESQEQRQQLQSIQFISCWSKRAACPLAQPRPHWQTTKEISNVLMSNSHPKWKALYEKQPQSPTPGLCIYQL